MGLAFGFILCLDGLQLVAVLHLNLPLLLVLENIGGLLLQILLLQLLALVGVVQEHLLVLLLEALRSFLGVVHGAVHGLQLRFGVLLPTRVLLTVVVLRSRFQGGTHH